MSIAERHRHSPELTQYRREMRNPRVNVPFDRIVEAIAGLGVPGLVLLTAMAISGWAGAAALTTALAALGGPLGMLGGVAVLGILGLAAYGIAEYGFEKIAVAVIKNLQKQGRRRDDVVAQIERYPISRGMKLKILDRIESVWPTTRRRREAATRRKAH